MSGRDCGDNRKEIAREFGRKTISMRIAMK